VDFQELFRHNIYHVAFRSRTSDDIIIGGGAWTVIRGRYDEWFADPFLFEHQGKTYLFAERMNRWQLRGSIAVCKISQGGNVSRFKEVLIEPFHLSYPNVFEYQGEVFMIPESGSNRDIRLYRAVHFPDKWKLEKVLIEGANFVDTSFIRKPDGDESLLCSYDWDARKSHYFKLDMNQLTLTHLSDNPLLMDERCGGNAFVAGGKTYRVLQDCKSDYGSKIIINLIENNDFENGKASDVNVMNIVPKDLAGDKIVTPNHCHTYNRSEHFEVVDFLQETCAWYEIFFSFRNKAYYEKHKDNQIQ